MTERRKLDDLVRRAGEDAGNEGVDCLVVYHFRDTGERLRARFHEAGLSCEEIRRPPLHVLADLSGQLGFGTVGLLDSIEAPSEIGGARSAGARVDGRPCRLHLAEHYPIPSRDDAVLALHRFLPPGSELFGYVGLDEPWLRDVLGESARALLERLGMSEDEPIVHPMVGKALRRAQARLDESRKGAELLARSSQEWMDLNAAGSASRG